MSEERVAAHVAALSDPTRAEDAALSLARVARSEPSAVGPAVPALLARLATTDQSVRHRVAQALAQAAGGGVDVPVGPLRDALRDDSDAVRQNAARALAGLAAHHPDRLTDERELIAPLLVDGDARVREFAGRVVGRMAGVDGTWLEPPDGTDSDGTQVERWRAIAALWAAREPLVALAAEERGEDAADDVRRCCRGIERAVLRGFEG